MAFCTEYMENLMQRVVANHPAEPEGHRHQGRDRNLRFCHPAGDDAERRFRSGPPGWRLQY